MRRIISCEGTIPVKTLAWLDDVWMEGMFGAAMEGYMVYPLLQHGGWFLRGYWLRWIGYATAVYLYRSLSVLLLSCMAIVATSSKRGYII